MNSPSAKLRSNNEGNILSVLLRKVST